MHRFIAELPKDQMLKTFFNLKKNKADTRFSNMKQITCMNITCTSLLPQNLPETLKNSKYPSFKKFFFYFDRH